MANCSDVSLLPLSEDYYQTISNEKFYFLWVDGVLTAAVLLLFAEECYFVVKTYKHFNITTKSIWLISIYPVMAVSALLAVLIPRASYICDFVSTCYLSACFFQFSSLLLLYFGHVDHLLAKVKDTGFSLRTRPLCCCCLCCPVLPPTVKSLMTVRLMIFQTAILQPIIQFISAVLWADDKYERVGMDFDESYVYLTILKVTSTLTAIYGVNALHEATRPHLRTHNTVPKKTALQLVQVFFNIQGAILNIPPMFGVPTCQNGFSSHFQMIEWHHLVLVVEMFLVSVLARLYYRRPLQLDAMLEFQNGKLADIYTTDQPHDDSVTNDSITEHARTASLDRGLVVNMSRSGQCRKASAVVNNDEKHSVVVDQPLAHHPDSYTSTAGDQPHDDRVTNDSVPARAPRSAALDRSALVPNMTNVALNDDANHTVVVVNQPLASRPPSVSRRPHLKGEKDTADSDSRSPSAAYAEMQQLCGRDDDDGVLNPSVDLTSDVTGNSTSDVTPRHDAVSEHDDRAARGSPISISSDRDVSFRRNKTNGVRSTVDQILGQNDSAAAAADHDGQSRHSPAKGPEDDSSQGVASAETGSINVRL